jgi:hypothetical protein
MGGLIYCQVNHYCSSHIVEQWRPATPGPRSLLLALGAPPRAPVLHQPVLASLLLPHLLRTVGEAPRIWAHPPASWEWPRGLGHTTAIILPPLPHACMHACGWTSSGQLTALPRLPRQVRALLHPAPATLLCPHLPRLPYPWM